jgi:hypothetical protein
MNLPLWRSVITPLLLWMLVDSDGMALAFGNGAFQDDQMITVFSSSDDCERNRSAVIEQQRTVGPRLASADARRESADVVDRLTQATCEPYAPGHR